MMATKVPKKPKEAAEPKPTKVQKARLKGDKEALSAMGKAAAKVVAENRWWKKYHQQLELADAAAQAELNRIAWDDDYRP